MVDAAEAQGDRQEMNAIRRPVSSVGRPRQKPQGARSRNPQRATQELARLTAPGMLGFYTHFEATEVFAVPGGHSAAANLFSIFVAEERLPTASADPVYLNANRIKLKSLKGWTFGIKRYVKPIAELVPIFDALCTSNEWHPSGEPLHVGDLTPIPTQFVPPDQAGEIPWNRVLKNNFWNGSHVLEWADATKTLFKPMFDNPPVLQELSEAVQPYVPLGLASMADRLGNVVIQLPTIVLMAKFGQLRATGDTTVAIAWHPKATPRALRATCEKQYDGVITGFMSANAEAPQTLLPMQDGPGTHRSLLWDDENRLVIAASGDLNFISAVALSMRMMDPEPRIFTVRDENGGAKQVRIHLSNITDSLVGEPVSNPAGDWTQRRIYRDEAARLAVERRFVQYKPSPGRQREEHAKALADVRSLISGHGNKGAWLWDPYLSADDILDTLFHCSVAGADLRALTAGYVPPLEIEPQEGVSAKSEKPEATFAERQRAILNGSNSNFRGLRLEYRIKAGHAGWAFHDRFLIFPGTNRGALAWTLGTSVNSLGKQHHILQRVDDGQLVLDAFVELWNELDQPGNLIWKKP